MTASGGDAKRIAIGLLLALGVAVGAGFWIQSRAHQGQAAASAERSAIASLRAFTETVQRVGLDGEQLQAAVAGIAEAETDVTSARVIKFKGIRLVASTAPEDTGDNAAPRKMAREEKPLYDLGQSLRANAETNVKEGRAWKPEIDVQVAEDGGLSLAGPVEEEGSIVGAVLLEARPDVEASRPGLWLAVAAVLVPVVILLALTPVLKGRRLASLGVAALLLLASVWLYGRAGLSRLEVVRSAAEVELSTVLDAKAASTESVLRAVAAENTTVDPASLDVDRFRRPRGVQTAAGVDQAQVAAADAAERASYWKLGVAPVLVSLLILAFFGSGMAERARDQLVKHRRAYFYVLPAMAGMTLLVFFPFFYGILLSFTNSNIYNTNQPIGELWVGFQNFGEILTDFELVRTTAEGKVYNYQNFYWTLGFTIIWTITNVAVGVTIGLFLALLLNTKGLVLKPVYRVMLILPWAVPNYITALIWQGMFHSQFGVINQAIQMFGGDAISWFDTPFRSFITVLSTNGWLSFPFMMVISLGALQSIPADLYEAARVDGASRWQQFKNITLPSLKPALIPAIIISVIWTFNQFNVIFLVSGGEPGGSTEILITEAYKIAFEQYRYGYAAAYSVVIFLVLFAYGLWQIRVTKATEGI